MIANGLDLKSGDEVVTTDQNTPEVSADGSYAVNVMVSSSNKFPWRPRLPRAQIPLARVSSPRDAQLAAGITTFSFNGQPGGTCRTHFGSERFAFAPKVGAEVCACPRICM